MKVRIDIASALSGLSDYGTRAVASLLDTARSSAADMESYAKINRPWTDRTCNARRTMEGVSALDGDSIFVGVEGHMPYSVFLELGYGGNYSVLAPTVHHFAPDALLGFARELNHLK